MATSPRRTTHLVPTHVRTPETLVTLAGVSLSVRQFFLLLVGASFSYQIWLVTRLLMHVPGGLILRMAATALPAGVALAFAFVTLAARTLDGWCLVLLRYALRPRRLIWRSIRFSDPGLLAGMEDMEDVEDVDAEDVEKEAGRS